MTTASFLCELGDMVEDFRVRTHCKAQYVCIPGWRRSELVTAIKEWPGHELWAKIDANGIYIHGAFVLFWRNNYIEIK